MLAKLTLSRTLKELSESPELGPKRPFKWGVLEVAIRGNLDPNISWEACENTGADFWHVARLLESSIVYEMS